MKVMTFGKISRPPMAQSQAPLPRKAQEIFSTKRLDFHAVNP